MSQENQDETERPPTPPPQPQPIWVYEWDLYEPYFTRNWTFTYHLTPLPGFKEQMKWLANEGNQINKWMPALTKVPELPPPDKKLPPLKKRV